MQKINLKSPELTKYKVFLCKKYLCKYSSLEKVESLLKEKGFKVDNIFHFMQERIKRYDDFKDISFS